MLIKSEIHSNIEWTSTPCLTLIELSDKQIERIRKIQKLMVEEDLDVVRIDYFPTLSETLLVDADEDDDDGDVVEIDGERYKEYDNTVGEITYRGADLVVFKTTFRFRWYNKFDTAQEIWTDHWKI